MTSDLKPKTRLPSVCLVAPEIPQNTGTIGRLALGCGVGLHLVKPLGFDISAKAVRRAGLDYWKFLDLTVHETWEDFLAEQQPFPKLAFLSTKGEKSYLEIPVDSDFIVFGRETAGLPKDFYDIYRNQMYCIPLFDQRVRSINLANSVSVVLYDQIRQRSGETHYRDKSVAPGHQELATDQP